MNFHYIRESIGEDTRTSAQRERSELGVELELPPSYRLLFECHPQPMWICTLESMTFIDVNHAAIHHYGYNRDTFLSMTMADLLAVDEFSRFVAAIGTVGSKLQNLGIWKQRRRDGSILHVEAIAHEFTVHGSRNLLVMAHDLTEQKLTEVALRSAEAKYRSIFENAIEGIFQTSPDGQYLAANRMLATIYGYSSPEKLIDGVTDIANQLYVEPQRRLDFMRLLETQQAVWHFESQVYRKDGSIIWISENARALFDEAGQPIGYEGTVEDITDRKRAEEELKLLQTLTLSISTSEDLNSALGIALQQICETTGWLFGEVWIPTADGLSLECCPAWYSNAPDLVEFRKLSIGLRMDSSMGLPGRVWMTKQPEWLQDVSLETDTIFLRQKTASRFGLRAALGIPILTPIVSSGIAHQPVSDTSNEVVAVMVFFMRQARVEDKRSINLVSAVATQLGSVILRKRAEEALRQSEERFRLTIDNAPIGMAIASLDGRFLRVNQVMSEITGYAADELLTMRSRDITHADDREADCQAMQQLIAGEIARFQICKRYLRKDRRVVDVMLNVSLTRDVTGMPIHIICQIEDVTDRRLAEEQIKHLAFHDPLTDLPNRALFRERLDRALYLWEHVRQSTSDKQTPVLAVLFLDLDRFKVVNDTLGHAIGDRLLQGVTQRLLACMRKSDTLARMGGDEFLILLPDIRQSDDAIKFTRKLLQALEQPFTIDGFELHVTASIGISLFPPDGRDAETLLKNADAAMYLAKEQGRDRYQYLRAPLIIGGRG